MKSTCTSSTLSVALHAITAGDPSCAGVKTSLTEALPLELQINIFEFLDIKSLIKARSTCSLWRDPLLLSAVHPVRRRLLDMYMSLTGSGVFLASRQRHVEACKPFDRVAYLRVLQSQQPKGVPVPEAFEMWILEWPALAAFDCIWPGLPYEWCPDDVPFRRHGWNLLANNPPQLFRLTIWDETQRKYVALPGLPICEDYRSSPMYWLVTGKGHELYGRVIRIESRHPIQRRRADKYTGETQNNGDVLDVEKYGLPFLDWLQVALERYCLGLRDSIRSKVYFDTETRSWRPTLDDSHMLDKPMYCEGGDLVRFTVFRQFVGPQVGVYMSFFMSLIAHHVH